MKTEIKSTQTKKEFKPFTIEITAETIEDARLLWHIFNCGDIIEKLEKSGYFEEQVYSKQITKYFDYEDWTKINEEIQSQGFKL